MKDPGQKLRDKILLVFLPLLAGLYLWLRSGQPPYGYPLSELSDQYWGLLIDTARKWQSGQFSFWDRSIGGGFCLYSSGFYPLWSPSNVLAQFVNFNDFYLFKLIEPHVIGIFGMFLLLRFGLKLNVAWSSFGALTYMGFIFTRYIGILHFPFFLWACSLYPLMAYFYHRFYPRPFYLRATILGGLLALIFLGGGTGQLGPLIIWSLILLTVDAWIFKKVRWFEWLIGCALFLFFTFSLVAIQMLPTLFYIFFESNRTLGEYAIDNFPLWGNDYKGTTSLTDILVNSFLYGGRLGVRAFWAIMIFALGKFIVDYKLFRIWIRNHPSIATVALTTLLFFILPPTAQTVANILPFTEPLFKPFKMFTFGYCGFLLDLLLVLFIGVVLSLKSAGPLKVHREIRRKLILLLFFVLAEIYLFLPFWIDQPALTNWLRPLVPQYTLLDTQVSWLDRFLTMLILAFTAFPFFSRIRWKNFILLPALIFLGSQLLFSSYICGEKGQKPSERYYFETPEHAFYRSMKGRYYLAYVDAKRQTHSHETMIHNFDLLFGVHGINGFLNIPPKRFDNFAKAYHKPGNKQKIGYKFSLGATPAAVVTHFPVEFTTIEKGMNLPWPGFQKVIDGAKYDVWVRSQPPPRVQFAQEIRVVGFDEILNSYDRPYDGTVYMTSEDFARYQPQLQKWGDFRQAKYSNFQSPRPDRLIFDVQSLQPVAVVLPEMFQVGWELRVDGKIQELFPANYLFIGFSLPAGQHQVQLSYRPVLWTEGLVLNIFALLFFIGLIFTRTPKPAKNA